MKLTILYMKGSAKAYRLKSSITHMPSFPTFPIVSHQNSLSGCRESDSNYKTPSLAYYHYTTARHGWYYIKMVELPPFFFSPLFLFLVFASLILKGFALWYSAQAKQKVW